MTDRGDPLVEESRLIIERGSKSFALASHLFDRRTRESAHFLYAWCRHCDDVIDGQVLGFRAAEPEGTASERLDGLKEKTLAAVRGQAVEEPIFEALARVMARHEIPERHPLELLEGFAMDVEAREYASLDDTLTYCYHVAGVVGVMMAYVMGVSDRPTLERASDLGIALQLTNIARDVLEDARMGRVYLPGDWLRESGVQPSEVLEEDKKVGLARVTAKLLDEAERYYRSGEIGFSRLPFRSAWAVATASAVYGDIGRAVRARGAEAWDERVVIGTGRKLALAAVAAAKALRAHRELPRRDLWTMRNPPLGS